MDQFEYKLLLEIIVLHKTLSLLTNPILSSNLNILFCVWFSVTASKIWVPYSTSNR
jgi:hypothetical protein